LSGQPTSPFSLCPFPHPLLQGPHPSCNGRGKPGTRPVRAPCFPPPLSWPCRDARKGSGRGGLLSRAAEAAFTAFACAPPALFSEAGLMLRPVLRCNNSLAFLPFLFCNPVNRPEYWCPPGGDIGPALGDFLYQAVHVLLVCLAIFSFGFVLLGDVF